MRRAEINAASQVSAFGWSSLFNGFAGKDSAKTKPLDLMPFPDELKSQTQLIPRTKDLLVKLIQENRLPIRAAAAAMQIEEVQKCIQF